MRDFYPFISTSSNNSLRHDYAFTSKSGIDYYMFLEAAPEYLPEFDNYEYLARYGYVIGFYPVDDNPTLSGVVDFKIGATICAIMQEFFDKNEKAVLLYHCDSSDGKQLKRKNLFDGWDNRYGKKVSIIKDHVILNVIDKNGAAHQEYLGYYALCEPTEQTRIGEEFERFANEMVAIKKSQFSL